MTTIHDEPNTRWATIRSFADGEDLLGKRDAVIAIQERRRRDGPPELARLRVSSHAAAYSSEQVDDAVKVGMVRGGPINPVNGFGWRNDEDRIAGEPWAKKILTGLPVRNSHRTPTSASAA